MRLAYIFDTDGVNIQTYTIMDSPRASVYTYMLKHVIACAGNSGSVPIASKIVLN